MKIAWITGGGTGIGRAIASLLVRQGYWVAISGRRRDALEETAHLITSQKGPGEIHVMPADVTDPDQTQKVIAALKQQSPKIHLLINNAGANPHHGLDETSLEEFQAALDINCLSAIRIVKNVLPWMRHGEEATIVNISSVLGKWGSAGSAAYSVSKYAMTGFTDILRQTLTDSGIHVMGVYPGYIQTAMTSPWVAKGSFKERIGYSPDSIARAIFKGIQSKKTELHFPWYVPWLLRFHRFLPTVTDRMANKSRF